MHIHPNTIGPNSINTYATGNDRTATAQRAAEVRKRLLKSAQSIDTDAACDPDATLLIGQWTGQGLVNRPSQSLPADEYNSAASGKDPDLG
jgi:hypothetical protein